MAKVKHPFFSESASGALDGIEFRANTYGNIVGRRSIPARRQTGPQLTAQGMMIAAHRAWEALTAAQQMAWNLRARYPATGRNTFIGVWSRWPPDYPEPMPDPEPSLGADLITDLEAHYFDLIITNIDVTWTPPVPCFHFLRIFSAHNFYWYDVPPAENFRYRGWAHIRAGRFSYLCPRSTPVEAFDIYQIDKWNGDILAQYALQLRIDW